MVTGIRDPLDRLWTHGDLDDTPDDGHRYEVIDGKLHVTPLPTAWHQRAISQLHLILGNHVEEEGLGEVFVPGLKVALDEHSGVSPDLVYVATDQGGLQRDGYHGPPALVVEVLSSKPTLDTVVKRDKYARAGIRYYWIVDPDAHTLAEFRLEGSEYIIVGQSSGEEVFRPELFPRLPVPLARLWRRPGSP